MKLSFLFGIVVILSSSASLLAQQKEVVAEAVFSGIAQPVPVKLPLPSYPKNARKKSLGGRVSVAVIVDETGKVTSADDADGPYPVCPSVTDPIVLELRSAAVTAAKAASFNPAVVNEKPNWAAGRLAYTFTSPMKPKADKVTGARVDPTDNGYRLDRMTKLGEGKPAESKSSSGTQEPKTVSGGVLNGKANSTPPPVYPAAAKAVRVGGSVHVQALILEDGTMYSAEAKDGHPLLRRSAEIAACKSRFAPTLLSGQPVKVSGIITYNFVP